MNHSQTTLRWGTLFCLVLLFSKLTSCLATDFSFVRSGSRLGVYIHDDEKPVVKSAYEMFDDDYRHVFERSTLLKDASVKADILIGTIGTGDTDEWVGRYGISAEGLEGLWETFRIQIVQYKSRSLLAVLGSDARGTAYGVLELSRLIGVSPWNWWADVTPTVKAQYTLPEYYVNQQNPSVAYRGICIDHEEWGLMPWSTKTFEPAPTEGQIGPRSYEKIFRLLLRLRANTLWPAMCERTVPFYATEGNKEMADRYGILLGKSCDEPLDENTIDGLKLWSDDGSGILVFPDSTEWPVQEGVYYHVSSRESPRDHLWLPTTSPTQIYTEMKRAWEYGARKFWMLNAGNIKPAEYEVELFLDLAWNINTIQSTSVFTHLQDWMAREFGEALERDLTRIKKEYYRLADIRKPETDAYLFGDEFQRRIDDYQNLSDEARELSKHIPRYRKDAYFELVEYPICVSVALNHKLLYAQKARMTADAFLPVADEYIRSGRDAYEEIVRLSDTYNHRIAAGKWELICTFAPDGTAYH